MVLVVPEQSQRPYRFGMTLLCVGALFNWLGLADTYSDPVPAIRYIGVGLIAAGASLICMAMCFWMRNIHDPNMGSDYDVTSDPVHVISVDPTLEKPPDYSTVVDVPPCYEDAIKLSPAALATVHKTAKSAATSNVASDKNANCGRLHTERNNSLQSGQSSDTTDFSTIAAERRQPAATAAVEKCEDDFVSTSFQSSQTENALAKVLRKSIRGIRRLRSSNSSEDSSNSSTALQPNVESGSYYNADRRISNAVEPTSKVNR